MVVSGSSRALPLRQAVLVTVGDQRSTRADTHIAADLRDQRNPRPSVYGAPSWAICGQSPPSAAAALPVTAKLNGS
jgi:hypothetical protein